MEVSEAAVARSLLWDAVSAQPERFDRVAIDGWFRRHAAWVDPVVIDGLVTAGTVNDPGRQHIPQPEDVLFSRSDGWFERYDPLRHGRWSVLGRPMAEAAEQAAAFGPPPVPHRSPRERFFEGVPRAMESFLGTALGPGEVWLRGGVRYGFELVSSDARTIGRTVWITDPGHGWALLSEAVWLLQQVPRSAVRFVVVGGDREKADRWLAKRGPLAHGVELYHFGNLGVVDLKAEARPRWHDRPAV